MSGWRPSRTATATTKGRIARAAWRLGLSYRRARSLWYAEPSAAVRAYEADQMRAAVPRLLRERRRNLLVEAAAIKQQLREHARALPAGSGAYQMMPRRMSHG